MGAVYWGEFGEFGLVLFVGLVVRFGSGEGVGVGMEVEMG